MFFILTGFYGTYFLKQFQLQRRGIQTNRLGKGLKPRTTLYWEWTLLLITYMIAIFQYTSCWLAQNMLWAYPGHLVIQMLGIVLSGLGTSIFVAALIAMDDNWRAGIDGQQDIRMVVHGIYRWSRNPAFVGFDLFYLGSAMAFPNLLLIVSAAAGILLLHGQILAEERYLAEQFGAEYTAYREKTNRYFLFF